MSILAFLISEFLSIIDATLNSFSAYASVLWLKTEVVNQYIA